MGSPTGPVRGGSVPPPVPGAKSRPPGAPRGPATKSQPPAGLPPGGQPFGKFVLLSRIAYGGMAEIFLARQHAEEGVERRLVIKRILPHVSSDPEFVRMFLDEARLAARLSHPNIVHLYDFGKVADSFFIAMEYVPGVTVGNIIRKGREQGVPIANAVRIGANVAEALYYAHRLLDPSGRPLGIVHRDVSPQNILISFDGTVKLVDFGIAKAATQATGTRAGVIKGKFAYMSPEQCRGMPIDHRTDLFAMGIVLYEMLTGYALYHRETEYETMRAIVDGPVPSARRKRPEVPPELDAVVQKALAKLPEHRFQTAGEMQMALEEYLSRSRLMSNAITLSRYIEELFPEESRRGGLVDSTPYGESFQRPDSQVNPAPPSLPSGAPPSQSGARRAVPRSSVPLDPVDPAAPAAPVPISAGTPMAVGDVDVDIDSLGVGPRKRFVRIGAAAVVAVISAIGVVAALVGREEHRPAPARVGGVTSSAPAAAATQTEAVAPAVPTSVEPAAAPALVKLRVVTEPSGARVSVDGRVVAESTPLDGLAIAPGPHVVSVSRDGYDRTERSLTAEGESVTVQIRLHRRGSSSARSGSADTVAGDSETPSSGRRSGNEGTLFVNTRPWSKVYLRGRLVGTTPLGNVRVPAGNLNLTLVDRDGNTHRRTVSVRSGAEARAFFDLTTGQ